MADGLWELDLIGQGPQGEAIVNTFHYVATVDEGAADDIGEQLVEQFELNVIPSFIAAVTDEWTGFVIRAQELSGPNQGQVFELNIQTTIGLNVGAPAPLQTTAIIRRQANGVGRKTRGRVYISPIPQAWVSVDGRVTDPDDKLSDLATALLSPLITTENTYVPALHELGGAPGANAREVVRTSVSPVAGVMKSRRVRFPN